ncbi:MAG: hypothetical protein JO307_18285 [Bryobacterales bacterium]|nr:hypothetical protein [Bryobacterales bacterium]MBV9396414.1 hypothetical protein [Bryobacterales bacterium]
MVEIRLTGPDGDNPLGFLTALGVVLALGDAGYEAALRWNGFKPILAACVNGLGAEAAEEEKRAVIVDLLYQTLKRVRGERADQAVQAKRDMKRAKTAVKKMVEKIKGRKLGREAAKAARTQELCPLEEVFRVKETDFKKALIDAGADPSIALGSNLTERNEDLIAHMVAACQGAIPKNRRWVDLAAAYGVGDPSLPEERMVAQPWALVYGGSRQSFLESVQELMLHCTAAHFHQALFGPWTPREEKHSLRLDTADDRRYALMDRNPTADGNEPQTIWGANRLAFEALRFFPTMAMRGGMGVRSWRAPDGDWQENCRVRWPLWRPPLCRGSIHSLLGLREIWRDDGASRERLRLMGVDAVIESRRIAVGKAPSRQFNLTPPTPVWISGFQGSAVAV